MSIIFGDKEISAEDIIKMKSFLKEVRTSNEDKFINLRKEMTKIIKKDYRITHYDKNRYKTRYCGICNVEVTANYYLQHKMSDKHKKNASEANNK